MDPDWSLESLVSLKSAKPADCRVPFQMLNTGHYVLDYLVNEQIKIIYQCF